MKKNYNQPEMQVMAMTPSYMVMAGSNLSVNQTPIEDNGGGD